MNMIWHRTKNRGHYFAKLCVQQVYLDNNLAVMLMQLKHTQRLFSKA